MLKKQLAELEHLQRFAMGDNIMDECSPQFIAVAKAAQEVTDAFADLPLTGFDTDERYGAEGRLEAALEQQRSTLAALSATLSSVKEGK